MKLKFDTDASHVFYKGVIYDIVDGYIDVPENVEKTTEKTVETQDKKPKAKKVEKPKDGE